MTTTDRQLDRCLAYLGASGKGRRTKGLKDEGPVLMQIARADGSAGWAVGRWYEEEGEYSMCMDPDISQGRVERVTALYLPSYDRK